MRNVQEAFSAHHRDCDEALAAVEKRLIAKSDCDQDFARFRRMLEGHFDAEEQILFPALEAAFPSGSAPVSVMRSEHTQARELCEEVQSLIRAGDHAQAAKAVDLLFSMLQSHNIKEEQILYPMCDRYLRGRGDDIARALAQLVTPSAAA